MSKITIRVSGIDFGMSSHSMSTNNFRVSEQVLKSSSKFKKLKIPRFGLNANNS